MTASSARLPVRDVRWPAIAFLVVLLELLAWNAWVWYRNQREFVPEDRPRMMPRNIAAVAARNNYDTVTYTFNMYYRLRVLRGKVLVLPELFKGHTFHLERVSRVARVELVSDVPIVPNSLVDTIYEKSLHLKIDVSSLLEVYVDPAVERYALARSDNGERYVILPEAMLRASAAPAR